MPRADYVIRLYSLLMDLVRSPRGLTAQSMAERHKVRLRTVYRDLEALRQAGFPIERTHESRWRVPPNWQNHLPFPLRPQEVLALHAAREFLRPLRGTPVDQAFQELYERLLPPLPLQRELFPYYRALIQTRSVLAIDYTAHLPKIETLCHAIQSYRTVRAVYAGLGREEMTKRELDPYRLYYDPGLETLYLFAWCHLRHSVRVFAVHRFETVRLTERTFSPPVDFDVNEFLRHAFRLWRKQHVQVVRFRVYPPLARWVAERRLHLSQKMRRADDGAVDVELAVAAGEDVKRFLLQLGAYAEVLSPASLRESIAQELRDALGRYDRATSRETLSPYDKLPLPALATGVKKQAIRAGARSQRKAR